MTTQSGPAASEAADPAASKQSPATEKSATSPSDSLLGEEKLDVEGDKKIEAHETTVPHKQVEDPNAGIPEWLPKNFVKEGKADFEAMAKSWGDLRTQIAQGKHKAPKDGKYELKAFGEEAKPDDPALKMYVDWAKEAGLSQVAFDSLATRFLDLAKTLAPDSVDPATYIAGEEKKLGQNAKAMVKGAADWGRSLIQKGILSRDDWDEWKAMAGTAGGVRIMLKMRELIEGPLPINTASDIEGVPSRDELFAMVGDPKYQSDPAYRAKVEGMFARAFPQQ